MATKAIPPTPRVEILANSGLSFIPAEFVRPQSERQHLQDSLNKNPCGVEIPIVDLGGFSSEEGRRRQCVEEVMAAAADWGVMFLVNHGVPEELIERLQAAGKGFFELPVDEKEKYANDQSRGQIQGYGSKLANNENGILEWQDYFFHLVYPPEKTDLTIWPTEPADYMLLNPKAISCRCRPSTVREVLENVRPKVDQDTWHKLEFLSLTQFFELPLYPQDNILTMHIINCWDIDRMTFNLGGTEVKFVPDEVALLVGMPNRGVPACWTNAPPDTMDARQIKTALLNFSPGESSHNLLQLIIKFLISNLHFPSSNFRVSKELSSICENVDIFAAYN